MKKTYVAATREGKKRVTLSITPADHKRLKILAAKRERSQEALLQEALDLLFAKHREP